jgi:hypothetical protein
MTGRKRQGRGRIMGAKIASGFPAMFGLGPRPRAASWLSVLALGPFLFWFATEMHGRNHRLAVNPHATGRIESTWKRYGKRGGLYATVTFTAAGAGGSIACRVSDLRIGPVSATAAPGQSIDLVPLPGSCARPDLPGQTTPAFVVWAVFGLSLVGCIRGALWLAGALGAAPPLQAWAKSPG